MIMEETRVKAGYEEIHDMATKKLQSLDEAVAKELEEVKVQIEEKFAKDKESLIAIIADCTELVQVEVPDEVPCEEQVVEEQPVEGCNCENNVVEGE